MHPPLQSRRTSVTQARRDTYPVHYDAQLMDAQSVDTVKAINYIARNIACIIVDALPTRPSVHNSRLLLAEFENVVPGSSHPISDSNAPDIIKGAMILLYIQSSLLRVCHEFLKQRHFGEPDMLEAETPIPVRHTTRWKLERQCILSDFRAALTHVWRLYNLSDNQVTALLNAPAVAATVQGLATEVGVFKRNAGDTVEPVFVHPGATADFTSMDIVYGAPVSTPHRSVICTIGLGLQRTLRVASEETGSTRLHSAEVVISSPI